MDHDDLFALDEDHPVPNLGVVDVNVVKKGGGSDLIIVIASPLRADRRSLERLLRKVEVYLEFLHSEQFQRESGFATIQNTRIVVRIHPDSDAKAFELLERNKPWVANNDAVLVIESTSTSLH